MQKTKSINNSSIKFIEKPTFFEKDGDLFVKNEGTMEEKPIIELQQIGHLGIIAAIAKKYKLVENIDRLLPKNDNN